MEVNSRDPRLLLLRAEENSDSGTYLIFSGISERLPLSAELRASFPTSRGARTQKLRRCGTWRAPLRSATLSLEARRQPDRGAAIPPAVFRGLRLSGAEVSGEDIGLLIVFAGVVKRPYRAFSEILRALVVAVSLLWHLRKTWLCYERQLEENNSPDA